MRQVNLSLDPHYITPDLAVEFYRWWERTAVSARYSCTARVAVLHFGMWLFVSGTLPDAVPSPEACT